MTNVASCVVVLISPFIIAFTSASDSVIATLYMKKRKEHRRITLRTQNEMKSFPLNVSSQFFFGSSFGGGGGGAAFDLFLGRMFLNASSILIQLKGILGLSENNYFSFPFNDDNNNWQNKVVYKACRALGGAAMRRDTSNVGHRGVSGNLAKFLSKQFQCF